MSDLRKLPPSPWGLPLAGHLHHLAGIPFLSLHALSKQLGSIFFMRLGTVPAIVISTSDLAKEVLKHQDQVFSSRPYILVGDYGLYHFQGIGPVPNNEHWKMMRRLCASELFTAKRLNSFLHIRFEELDSMLGAIRDAALSGEVVDVRSMVSTYTFNTMTRILMNRRFFEFGDDEESINGDAKQFKDIVFETADEGLQFHISEFIPSWLRWIDWKVPELKKMHAKKDKFLQSIVDEHKNSTLGTKETMDFMDIMLQTLENKGAAREDFIKAVVLELTIAGTDTSASIIEWIMLELLHNPNVLRKLKEELNAVVGSNRLVEDGDFQKLEYLNAVIKEGFRLHPPLPLLIPHMNTQDSTIAGFHIPKDSFTFVNVYSIGRDPKVWENPDQFLPERFMGNSVDVRGQDFELLPFGSGRRACAGMVLGLKTVQLVVSNLVHAFDWSFVPEKPSSDYLLEERHGTVNWVKSPLHAKVTPRTGFSDMKSRPGHLSDAGSAAPVCPFSTRSTTARLRIERSMPAPAICNLRSTFRRPVASNNLRPHLLHQHPNPIYTRALCM